MKRMSMLFALALTHAALAAAAAPRCDWAGKVGGRSIWLSTEGLETATELPVLWGGSSPVPSVLTRSADGRVTLTKAYSHPEHPDWAWTRTLSFVPNAGDSMECVFFETRANRPGKDVTVTGTVSRLPPLPPRPDLGAVKYGEPVDLLKDGLDGFDVLDNGRASQWRFVDGVLENGGSGANIRTKRGDFMDFRISYDVRVDKDCNSGVYLRGIYELQVSDSFGKPVDSHNMAALYGRIAPSVSAEKPAGEWQHVEAILCCRHLTVTLNGVRIIDNKPIRGITGGALSTDESAPGPIGLQGDHKGGAYRNLILTPILRGCAELSEVRVSDFGFDPTNSTRFVQAAINTRAKRVVIDRQASPWIVEPLFGVSDQEIFIEAGVEVQALRGAFRDRNDCLISYVNVHDVRLAGGEGATLRMWHDDYLKPPYATAEWRHCVKLLSVSRATIEGLALRESGGDGLYVANSRGGAPCRDIVARRILSDGNARQGSSIITVENLLYEDCVFSNTSGRPPQDGIDIEPNGKDQLVRNCVFRRCRFADNKSTGFAVALFHHDITSPPVSVRLEDCSFSGNSCGFSYCQNAREMRDVRGSILLKGCRFEKTRNAAISLSRKTGGVMGVGIVDCVIENCCTGSTDMAEVQVAGLYGPSDYADRIAFRNLKVVQPVERRWVDFVNMGYGARRPEKIVGNVTVTSPAGTRKVVLDAAFRAAELPTFWSDGEPPRRPLATSVTPVDDCPGRLVKLAGLRPRGKVRYVFFAPKAGTARFAGHVVRIGKKPLANPQFEVRSLRDGTSLTPVALSDEKGAEFEIAVPSAGLYALRADLGGHSYVMTQSDIPVALDFSETPASFVGAGGAGWFWAKKGADFNVAVSGEGCSECIGAELADPSGKVVWTEDSAACWRGTRIRGSAEGLWKVVMRSPKTGHTEDNHLDVVGTDGVVFLSSEKYWK